MNLYIGKIQDDGVVKYIALPYEKQYQNVPRILRTFYRTEARTDALLNLGNLVTLQPSPYNKWKGYEDTMNCRAEIRDDGEKKGKHLPQFADTLEEYASQDAYLFLFQKGSWHFKTENGFEDLATVQVTFAYLQDAFKGIDLYQLSEKGELNRIDANQYSGWKAMQHKAASGNNTIYAFRGDKLITTVNHPLNY